MKIGLPLLAVAAAASAIAAASPSIPAEQSVRNILFTIDITGSMNVRDYGTTAAPHSRLDEVRQRLPGLIRALPCGSRAGLAIFTERQSFTFFRPVEVCANFTPIIETVNGLDWRMGWDGDSRISSGINSALAHASDDGADLVFFTDGHEAPPLPYGGRKRMVNAGDVHGLIVGVGGTTPAPIPKYDDRGREIGFYGVDDMVHGSRMGMAAPTAKNDPGFHPRNNPYGEADLTGTEHLSSVRTAYLSEMATEAGLSYAPLDTPDLGAQIMADTRAIPLAGRAQLSPGFAIAALAAALASFLIPGRLK